MTKNYNLGKIDSDTQIRESSCTSMNTEDLLGLALFPKRNHLFRKRKAKKLLCQTNHNLAPLFSDRLHDFYNDTGLDENQYASFRAMRELLERAICQELSKQPSLASSEKTRKLLLSKLRFCKIELFVCMYLNSQYYLTSFEEHTSGTVHSTFVYPREIVKRALELGSSAVIIAHNHPSGEIKPSKADLAITKQIKEALQLVEITLLDHLIIGGNHTISFAEKNFL